jgi:dimethylsulfone monooxygenase
LGIWTPAPLSVRPDAKAQVAFDALTRQGGGIDRNYLYASDMLQRAEQLGFEITLVAQRFFGPDLDSWVFATALATQTKTIEIMAAVHPGIMDPRTVAKHAVSIDRVSGGRFCVNIVNGSRPEEFHAFGKWLEGGEARYRRMQEFIEVLKLLWTGQEVAFKGEFYAFDRAGVPTRSVRTPYPPIYAASRVDEGMNVVAQECDAWFVNCGRDFREHDASLKRMETEMSLMRNRCAEIGRPMEYCLSACVILADTDEEAFSIGAEYVERAAIDPRLKPAASAIGANLIGSPATVLKRVREYESLGIDMFMLQFYPVDEGFDRFALDVLPSLRNKRLLDRRPNEAFGTATRL